MAGAAQWLTMARTKARTNVEHCNEYEHMERHMSMLKAVNRCEKQRMRKDAINFARACVRARIATVKNTHA